MTLPDSAILKNLNVSALNRMENPFEKLYIRVRTRENRLYDDREVWNLPNISTTHPHSMEWASRSRSASRLCKHLTQRNTPLQILEIGCGNGWLCNQLSSIPASMVTGLDINFTELQQAARVFNGNRQVQFIYGDLFSGILRNRVFDAIVFAAAIQYFPSLQKVLSRVWDNLNTNGEIHILDTFFYRDDKIEAPRERTRAYYANIGVPAMADYYFHRSFKELDPYRYRLLFNPDSLVNRLISKGDPFPWICIKKN